MKKLLLGLTLLMGFTVGCSSSNEEVSEDTNTTETVESVDTPDDVRIYQNLDREVEVPVNPERIVTPNYFGEVSVLGLNVVGADFTWMSNAWEEGGYMDGVKDIGQSVESIAALEPDLIVTYNLEQLEQYESIAPTIYIPYGTYDPEDLVLELGSATGRDEEAQAWVDQFDANTAELATHIPDPTQTYSILDIWGGQGYLYGENFGRGGYIIYNKLGLKGPDIAEEEYIREDSSYLTLTVEAMPTYIGDVLMLLYDMNDPDSITSYTDNVVYENLDCVVNDNVYEFDSADFQYADPISLDYQVDILRETFDAKN